MKIKQSIFVLGLGIICLTTACKKTEEPSPAPTPAAPLAKAESEALMNNTSVQMKADIKDMRNAEGVKKLEAMQSLPDKTGELPMARTANSDFENSLSTTNSNGVIKLFKKIMLTAPVAKVNARTGTAEDTLFDFKKNLGTYTWNDKMNDWDKSTNAIAIEINFPTDTTKMGVNDGKLIVNNYAETIVEEGTFPTSMIGKFTIAGVVYASINYAGSFNNKYITLMNMKAYLKPWNFQAEGKDNGSSATATYKVFKDNAAPITIASVNVTFENGEKEKPLLGTASFQYRDMKVAGKVMAKEIMQSDKDSSEVTELQMNTWLDFDVLRSSDDAKVADIYIQDSEKEPILIKLNDGTTKIPEAYFQNVIDELEAIEKEF